MNECDLCFDATMNRALTTSVGGNRYLLCNECRWYEDRLRKMSPAQREHEEKLIMEHVAREGASRGDR